ncbi:ABC transporter ATP-binding protein [Pseudonocardia phyllosphaerae]|uniref:ABC transporter ATP-binding protein n=1 Tax=Pseudonocardia phyllosphaerae TaxID=3390502 RepID=UPI00397CDFA2
MTHTDESTTRARPAAWPRGPREPGGAPPAVATHALTKRFGRVVAVDGVDLEIPAGSRFGLLGPNGSGKTTIVRMLLGLVHATSGRIEVLGRPMPRSGRTVLPRVGALVESPAAWPGLSGRANLTLLDAAGAHGGLLNRPADRHARVREALDAVGLGGVDRRPVKAYSLGMRQRLGIASALLRRPELLLLDEPTNGLDPRGIGEIRQLLLRLNAAGTTVVLSSHLLAEVEALCTRVGVMDRGHLVLAEDLDTLRGPTGRVVVRTPMPVEAARLLGRAVEHADGDRLWVRAHDVPGLNAHLVGNGLPVAALEPERRTLEQVVLERTGEGSDRVGRAGA